MRNCRVESRIITGLLALVLTLQLAPRVALAEGGDGLSLLAPASVSLTTQDGTPFETPQELTLTEPFYLRYDFPNIAAGVIDSTKEYALPRLPGNITLTVQEGAAGPIILDIYKEGSTEAAAKLGVLRADPATGAMTFQFDPVNFPAPVEMTPGLSDFFLKIELKLDKDSAKPGDSVKIEFPFGDGAFDATVSVVDDEKDAPTVDKTGPSANAAGEITGFDPATNEITWKIAVAHGDNPQKPVVIRDAYSANQEYVSGSFSLDEVAVADTDLTIDDTAHTVSFEIPSANIKAGETNTITYKTRIKNTAFLNKSGVPLKNGTITCDNTAQAFYPGGEVAIGEPDAAQYKHPIRWMQKTSGNVIDRTTGEMEWTITIYSNGLGMKNVMLYDRLSPGVVIKGNTATIQTGGAERTLADFKRTFETDQLLDGNAYNLTYALGELGGTSVIKYRTIIADPDAYDAGAHQPPDSIYDNKAFIAYQLEASNGTVMDVLSPVVEKDAGYDAGLLGKLGEIERAYHTVKWTLTVNEEAHTLANVVIDDTFTPNGTTIHTPAAKTAYEHIYEDLERNIPTVNGVAMRRYDPTAADNDMTYEVTAAGLRFRLGDITDKKTIVFRSTVADPEIYAKNISNNTYYFENKASITTDSAFFGYASAQVPYVSTMLTKTNAMNFWGDAEQAYDFVNNRFGWTIIANANYMKMEDICIADTLMEGTSLVGDSVRVVEGNYPHYTDKSVSVPKGSAGDALPYYTYNETTRELRVYMEDIPDEQVGKSSAQRRLFFYVQVDTEHPVFNDPAYPGYSGSTAKEKRWTLHNTAKLINSYLPEEDSQEATRNAPIPTQLLEKTGDVHLNGGVYSADYSVDINRLQKALPDGTQLTDILPAALKLDPGSIRLYEATVQSLDMYGAPPKEGNGTVIKGAEVDPDSYSFETKPGDDGATELTLTLPNGTDGVNRKIYVLEYSCEITDASKAPISNSVRLSGEEHSDDSYTITSIMLQSASGGGNIVDRDKTTVRLIKKDADTGAVLQGAEFGLYYKDNLVEKKETDADGQIVFEGLYVGLEYTVRELPAPENYFAPLNVSETFIATEAANPVELEFENESALGVLRFIKTDQNGVRLAGATFGLWLSKEDVDTKAAHKTAVSEADGIVSFKGLEAGKTYYVKEIFAPAGYRPSGSLFVAVMDENNLLAGFYADGDATQAAVSEIANELIADAVSVSVRKAWEGDANPAQPQSVQVQLYADGAAYGAAQTLDASVDWTHTWRGLDPAVTWTVQELTKLPQGYTSAISGTAADGFVITNTFKATEPVTPPRPPIGPYYPPATPSPTFKPSSGTPQTGDASHPVFWGAVALLSGAGIVAYILAWYKDKGRQRSQG